MPTNRQLDRTISGWLEAEAPGQLPDRVLRATFERTRRTRQQGGWRVLLGRIHMPRSVLALGGAALVVVVAAVALTLNNANQPGVGGLAAPSPSPTPSPTATVGPPTPSPTPADLPEGSHLLFDESGLSMTVTIPAPGWYGEQADGTLIKKDNDDPLHEAGMITFTGDLYVYGDPCRWSTTKPHTPATTVDEFVTAMVAQASRDASAPVDITVDGYAGKSITLHVPLDAVFSQCDQSTFGSWTVPGGQDPYRYNQAPGQIDKLSILDVDGELVVIDIAYYARTPQAVVGELEAIVSSGTFSK